MSEEEKEEEIRQAFIDIRNMCSTDYYYDTVLATIEQLKDPENFNWPKSAKANPERQQENKRFLMQAQYPQKRQKLTNEKETPQGISY